jgi:hypothetical protein
VIAEQLAAIVDSAIVIAIQRQEGIAGVSRGPGDLDRYPTIENVELDAVLQRGQMETMPGRIDDNR